MGLVSSHYETLIGRPRKRLRTEQHELGGNIDCVEQQEEFGWSKLPYVILLEIYCLLPAKDKCNMSLTCKSWREPLSRPSVWRCRYFRFNGEDDWQAVRFVRKLGSGLRYVTVDGLASCSGLDNIADAYSPSKLATFLRLLIAVKNTSLVTLEVKNTVRLERYITQFDLVGLMMSLLKEQSNLRRLSLINAGLYSHQSMLLLGAAITKSDTTLQRVEIVEYSVPSDYLDRDGRLLCFIERMTNLSELSINYTLLSDDLLFLLSRPISATLSLMRLWVSHSDLVDSTTSPEAWDCLVSRFPNLKAEYIIWECRDNQSMYNILYNKLPLTYLCWNTGSIVNSSNIVSCLIYIQSSFQKHLRQLDLQFQYVFSIDENFVAIVTRCETLEVLRINSMFLPHSRELRLIRMIRTAVYNQPASRLKLLIINDKNYGLEVTAVTLFFHWLLEAVQ